LQQLAKIAENAKDLLVQAYPAVFDLHFLCDLCVLCERQSFLAKIAKCAKIFLC